MHACMHVSGWRDVWMSGGRTPLCFARIHQPASAILHTRTHACVQCTRSACVAPSLRIPPQGSGGVTRTFLGPFSSLLFAFATQTAYTATWLLPASLPDASHYYACASWCAGTLRADSAAPQTQRQQTQHKHNTQHAPHTYTYFTLYSTYHFRKFVASIS